MNTCLGGIFLLLEHFSSGNEIIPPRMMAYTLLLAVNGGIILGFLLKYFSEWRNIIQEEFNRIEAKEKHPFYTNRFNKIS